MSNYAGKETIVTCQRYDRNAKKKVDVECPSFVSIYNAFMGGFDKSDRLLALHRTKYRSRKWYHRIVFHLFKLPAVNAWVIYRKLSGNGLLLKFLSTLRFSLIKGVTVNSTAMADDARY